MNKLRTIFAIAVLVGWISIFISQELRIARIEKNRDDWEELYRLTKASWDKSDERWRKDCDDAIAVAKRATELYLKDKNENGKKESNKND